MPIPKHPAASHAWVTTSTRIGEISRICEPQATKIPLLGKIHVWTLEQTEKRSNISTSWKRRFGLGLTEKDRNIEPQKTELDARLNSGLEIVVFYLAKRELA
jgi:hypothetical protein